MIGLLNAFRITQNTTFNLFEDTQGKGAIGITLRNDGQTPFYLDDGTQELVLPGEVFTLENTIPLVNAQFSIRFVEQNGKYNSAIMRYIVPL